MPVLESTDHINITPKSAIRHRPIAEDAEDQGKGAVAASGIAPVAERASRLRQKKTEEQKQTQENEDIEEWKLAGADESAPKKARASAVQPPTAPAPRPKKLPKLRLPVPGKSGSKGKSAWRIHPLLYLGIGMIIMLALWTLLTMAMSWWNTTWDDIHYGRPRTYQIDAVVGHNDSPTNPSHFIAINLNGRIEVIEFPGGDGSKARIYIGPQLYGSGEELIPVTLSFVDVNANHQPDMIIHFQDTQIVFINDKGGFRPATPDELHSVEQYLQQHGQ